MGRHRPARLEQQHGQHRSLLGRAEVDGDGIPQHSHITQNFEPEWCDHFGKPPDQHLSGTAAERQPAAA
jgi:hypothetical protein